MTYKIQATKNRKEVTEEVEGMRSVSQWLSIYKRNGFTINSIDRVR